MKQIEIKAWGKSFQVCAAKRQYMNGRLAIELLEANEEPFGVLTVNLDAPLSVPEGYAFVKDWGENEKWAEDAAKALGGKPTGMRIPTGFVCAQLWDFNEFLKSE